MPRDPMDVAFDVWWSSFTPITGLTTMGVAMRAWQAAWTARDGCALGPNHPDWGKVRGQVDQPTRECPSCHGLQGDRAGICPRCEGEGEIPVPPVADLARELADLKARVEKLEKRQTPQAGPEVLNSCPACKGKGVVDTGSHGYTTCSQCKGTGQSVFIPHDAPAPGGLPKEGEQR
jgi:hypothetical protein